MGGSFHKYFSRYFLLWVILVHAIFFIAALFIRSIYNNDSYEYLWQAVNLKAHHSLYCWDMSQPLRTEMFTRRTVLYGLLLMVSKMIYASDFSMLALQNILSIISIYLFTRLWRRFGFEFNTQLLVLLAFILFPTWFVYTNMLMSELLLAFFMLWGFYYLLEFSFSRKLSDVFVANVFLVLAVLTKPVLLYFWIPELILLGYWAWQQRRFVIVMAGLLIPLAISIHSAVNQQATGYFHYSSIKNHNLLHYNTDILLTQLEGRERAKAQVDSLQKLADAQPDFRAYNDFIVKTCTAIHLHNLPVVVKIQLGGMLNFFIDPGRYDLEQFFPPKKVLMMSFFHQWREKGVAGIWEYARRMPIGKSIVMLLVMLWNVVVLAAFVFFLIYRRIPLMTRIITALFVLYVCVLTGPMGDSRFKMPVYPMLVFCLPFFIQWLKDRKWLHRKSYA